MLKDNRFKFMFIIALTIASVWILVNVPLNLGLDLQGGTRLVLEGKDTPTHKVDYDSMLGALKVIRSRVDALGVSEPLIQRKGDRQIIVELPGVKDPERALKIIGTTALLEFAEAENIPGGKTDLTPEQILTLGGPDARLMTLTAHNAQGDETDTRTIIVKKTAMTGASLLKVWPGSDQYGRPVVHLKFNSQGGELFYQVTGRCVGKPLAIILDGHAISAPIVQDAISGGQCYIEGLSLDEMRDLVISLKAGSLPVPVEIIANQIVGPTLGRDSIAKSKFAGIIGLVGIVLFMVAYYRLPGILASVSLGLYVIYVLAILALMHATLTLPGIAGLILTLGMAVDANVIIFARIREELREDKTFRQSIINGFGKAFWTIFDSNLTTLISAVVLFWLGTGTIKGFAVTLSVGILVSMFTAIFVTRVFMDGIKETSLANKKHLM